MTGTRANLFARDHIDDLAMFHHIMAISYARGKMEILFNQYQSMPHSLHRFNRMTDLLNDDRSKPFGWLIE